MKSFFSVHSRVLNSFSESRRILREPPPSIIKSNQFFIIALNGFGYFFGIFTIPKLIAEIRVTKLLTASSLFTTNAQARKNDEALFIKPE